MTDDGEQLPPEWVPVLARISRASGHELRNALNALVVNLEVVRSKVSDPDVQPFINQSIEQSEESVRLAESAIALLNLVVSSIGHDGQLAAEFVAPASVRLQPPRIESERLVRSISALADRGAITVDTSESAVILSVSDTSASAITE